ncbi:MAG: transcription elongation factor GreA [Candidatus Margulisiibacteriota bacterium]
MIDKKSYDELKEKLDLLKTVKREVIRKAIAEAREHGDLKENSAYHTAKQEQSLNETRIKDLEERLINEEVVEETSGPKDSVVVGATVRLLDMKSKEETDYKIAYELGINVFENIISVASPLGQVLMGRKEKDIVELNNSRGIIKFKILKIS